MFATSGYFKGVDCPYYLSGLCERPYCHLRHVKKDGCRDASSTFTSSSNYVGGSRPSSPLDPALSHGGLQCSGPTGSKPVGPGGYLNKPGPTGNTSCAVPFKEEIVEEYSVDGHDSEGPLYEPTPKYDITVGRKKRQNSTDCQYKPGGPAVEVPEYEPNHAPGTKPDETPVYKPGSVPKKSKLDSYVPSGLPKVSKSQAKKRRANPAGVPDVIPEYVPSAVPQYNPTPINQLKRMKKTPDTESEYDPVNNYMYSTNQPPNDVGEVVYVPTKRSKIEGEDDMFINEFGGSDDAKFSDDDHEDDSELIMDSGRYESPLEEESDEEVSEIFAVKPFFKDTISDKPAVDNKGEICENELKHPIRKPVSTEKKEGDKTSGNDKKEQCEKSEIDNKLKDKLEKSSKHSSSSKSSSSEKGSDASKKKDKSASSSKSSSKSSKASDNKSAKHSSSSHKRSSSSEKSHSSNGASHNKSKHSEKDKSRHKENGESDKSRTKESSAKYKEKQSSPSSSPEKKHKSDSQKSHSSSHKQRSSSKDSTHHHRDSRDKSKESDGKKSHSSHSRSSSSSHSHGHSSKSSSKSEKENKNKHEKSKSSSSKSPKDKDGKNDKDQNLAHINADLFGSESEEEGTSGKKSNNNSHDMTDAELAMFLEDSDFECETDTFEECLKIFNEEAPSFKKQTSEKKAAREPSESTNASTSQGAGKKRVAHMGDTRPPKRAAPKPAVKMSPAEVMHNRLMEMQRRAAEAAEARKAVAEAQAAITSRSSSSQSFGGGLKRTAHMPKLKSSRQGSLDDRDDDKRTVAITAARGEKRKAHAPTLSNVKRPMIPAEFGSKVPSNIRQRYLNLIIDECLKICKTEEEAYKKGQEEEAAVYKRATNKNIYLRVAVNAIKRLRVEVQQSCSSPTKSPSKIIKQSHEATLGGKNATKTTYTLHRSGGSKAHTEDFRGAELYKRLSKYILTEEQLRENGYPRPSELGGSHAKFYAERKEKDVILKQHEKNCARCGKRFIVFPNGNYNREEECVYHWGKAWKKRVDRALVSSYNCCGGDLGAEGCQVCKYHVFESNKSENVTGYMKTIPSSPPIDGDYGVYAMDCEMVYTKGGMELARVTVIDPESKPVYETLVKPGFPVVDYNTRFSGLTEKDLQDVTTSLRDVQAVLLSLFTDRTILIGHSLESDLISVKIIHNTVVDTSVVFPHRLGPPYKRALRNLMVDFLQKIIQDDVGGHDSQEDAVACLQLMQWKLKEDAMKEVRRV